MSSLHQPGESLGQAMTRVVLTDDRPLPEIAALFGVSKNELNREVAAETGRLPKWVRHEHGWVRGVSPARADRIVAEWKEAGRPSPARYQPVEHPVTMTAFRAILTARGLKSARGNPTGPESSTPHENLNGGAVAA